MMEHTEKGLEDYIGIFKRYKHKMLLIAMTAFLLTVIIALKWPATYQSTATILIEQQEIPQDLVRSTVTGYADQRIQIISQRVMSSINLKKIIDKFALYQQEQKTDTFITIVENMKENIHLDMVSANILDLRSGKPAQVTIAFTLAFDDSNPQKAQQVTNELVNLYLGENLRHRTAIAAEATDFLAIEVDKLSQLVSGLEKRLADFKEINKTSLPELQQLNMTLMDRTEQQLFETNRQLASAIDRVVYLEAELSQLAPNMSAFSITGERIFGSQDRLKSLQAQFVGLKARYASDHPDVIKMQKEMEALENEVGGVDKLEIVTQLKDKRAELAILSKRYSADHPDVKKLNKQIASLQANLNKPEKSKRVLDARPDNPAYIQLKAQLRAAKAEQLAMRAVKNKLIKKMEKYEEGLLRTPQVEREYLQLTREHQNAVLKYREVKAKQMEADMAQAMEKGRKAERFSLIEPPLTPEEPFKPNRMAILFLGLILSTSIPLAYVLVNESMNSAIYGSRRLIAVTGEQPLIVIPYIENPVEIEKALTVKRRIIYTSIGIVVLMAVVFHFYLMPFDVLWFSVLRKLGIN